MNLGSSDLGSRTILHWSAYNGTLPITRCALFFGADIAAVDGTGDTALHWACIKGNMDAVMELLFSPSNTDFKKLLSAVDAENRTARDWVSVAWGPDMLETFDEIVRLRELKPVLSGKSWIRNQGLLYIVSLPLHVNYLLNCLLVLENRGL